MELAQPGLAQHLSQRIDNVHLREDYLGRQVDVVVGHRQQVKIGNVCPLETIEIREGKGVGKLAGAVGAEVEKEQTVARLDQHILIANVDGYRQHELVGDAVGVGARQRFAGCGCRPPVHALVQCDDVVAQHGALPALVAIHGVVATADGRDGGPTVLQARFQVACKTDTALRRRVAAVGDQMQHRRNISAVGDVDERV